MVTDRQIEALLVEAGIAGDSKQARLCKKALNGDAESRAQCERVIGDAVAMSEVYANEDDSSRS